LPVPTRGFDPPIIGSSPAAARLRDLVLTLAGSEVRVLITGESGVGKEVLARNLHRFSRRRSRRFVAVNCAALAPGTLESELFGHDRGAFTGAVRAHEGLFEQASGGTLFLDEIGEIPPWVQAKLLRVLQDGEVRRMGESITRRVDVRLLAATNAGLADMVERGAFRKDLYFRINVVHAPIAPLRRRGDDVFELIESFFQRRSMRQPGISDAAREMLRAYDWPGNVRELENELQRLIALHPPLVHITPDMLSDRLSQSSKHGAFDESVLHDAPLSVALNYVERNLLQKTLVQTNWNKSKTARRLGLSRQGLLKKIDRHGLSREALGLPFEETP